MPVKCARAAARTAHHSPSHAYPRGSPFPLVRSEAAQRVKESVTGAAADVKDAAREVAEVRGTVHSLLRCDQLALQGLAAIAV